MSLIKRIRVFRELLNSPLLFYVVTLVGISNGFILPFLKKINAEITGSYFAIALGEALFIIALATMGMLWGIVFDVVENRKIPMICALECSALFVFLTSQATMPHQYVIFRLLTGFFASAVYPFIISVATDIYGPGRRVYIFLLVGLVMNIMVGIGVAIALFLSYFVSWRHVITIYSEILACGSLFLCLMSEPRRGQADAGMRYGWPPITLRGGIELVLVLKKKTNILLALQGFFGSVPWGAIGLFLIYAVAERLAVGFLTASAIMALCGLAYPFSLALAPRVDRLRESGKYMQLVGVGMALIILQTISFIMAICIPLSRFNVSSETLTESLVIVPAMLSHPSIIAMLACYCAFLLAASLVGPITRNIIADVNMPRSRATALVTIRLSENLGNAVGLVIAGMLVDSYGSFVAPLKIISISWILCALLWIPILRHYARDATNSAGL